MRILAIVALLVPASVWAACPYDLTGTYNKWAADASQPDEYGVGGAELYCDRCRNINDFPLDTRNFLWNELIYDNDSNLHDAYLAMWSTRYKNPAELTVPVCNRFGQCSTNSFLMYFNRMETNLPPPRDVRNSGIRHIKMVVRQPNGTAHRETYPYTMIGRVGFPVPSDTDTDDAPKECLNNLGQHLEQTNAFTNGGLLGGADDPEWVDPYEHWRDEEDAYGGRTGFIAYYRCNWTSMVENKWQCELL